MTTPATFLGTAVPDDLKDRWHTWEAADWRKRQHNQSNRLYPPDERFNVRMPRDMCERHANNWLGYRNMRFDPVTGDPWPGTPSSPFLFNGRDMDVLREERRTEWDEKASLAMRGVEQMCRGGRGNGCSRRKRAADVVELPASRAAAEPSLAEEAA